MKTTPTLAELAQGIADDMLEHGWTEYYKRTGDDDVVVICDEIREMSHAEAVSLARAVRAILLAAIGDGGAR